MPALLLLLAGPVQVQPTVTSTEFATDVRYAGVMRAEASWEAANLHRDATRLAQILLREFVQINEDGTVMSKDAAIQKWLASANRPRDVKVEK